MNLRHDDPCLWCDTNRASRRLQRVLDSAGMAFVLVLALIIGWLFFSMVVPPAAPVMAP